MRKPLVFLITAALLAAFISGCGPPANFGPDDVVVISGRFIDENGEPMANTSIGIWKLDPEGISLDNYWYPDPDDYELTEEDGTFEIRRLGEDFLWPDGSSKYIFLFNIDSLAGPVTAMGFYVTDTLMLLPDAKLWMANVAHTIEADTVAFNWDAVDDVAGQAPDRYNFSSAVFYWNLWSEQEVSSGFKLPVYIFQDYCGGWRIAANIDRATDNDIDWSYMSETNLGTNLFPNTSHTLLSSGKPGYAAGQDTVNFVKLTNRVWHEQANFNNTNPVWVMLDLETSQAVNAFVVYGLWTNYAQPNNKMFDQFEVYVADDTTTWGNAVATSTLQDGYIRFDFAETTGRYVKFQANDGSNIQIVWVREMAAFGPTAE